MLPAMLPIEVRISDFLELTSQTPMSTLVKVQHKGQVTIPTRLRRQAGISEGDLVEASFHRGKIVLAPKLVIDRPKFPTADDEYTPEQRRIIDARLAEAEEDFKAGRSYGPFGTHKEFIASLHREAKKLRAKRTKPVSR
jgi:AbrB family looped-hinge helix DNA binding protein